MSAIEPTSSYEGIEIVCREELDHEAAADLLRAALEQANSQLTAEGKTFQVIYNGQPHLNTPGEANPKVINPTAPLDLALLHRNGMIEPIDIVDVVVFVGYKADQGRLTSGFKTVDDFAYEITQKVHHHLAAKTDPHYLISAAGSKYEISPLKTNILAIDPQDYIRVNGYRVIYYLDEDHTMPKILAASSLRASLQLHLDETTDPEKIYFYEPEDPGPRIYIDLTKVVQVASNCFPKQQQDDALTYDKPDYLIQGREPGKI